MRTSLALLATLLLLSVGSGATASTSTPPQNGLIAVTGPEGIYLVDPRSGTAKVVPNTAEMGFPAWSPDGTMLAVTAEDAESSSVYTMKPDGSERRLVLENAFAPSWSPEGKQLVVVREGTADVDQPGNELVIVNADGSEARTLDFGAAEWARMLSVPAWSPDGKLIAFVDLGEGTIRFVSPDGKVASKPVVAAVVHGPSWSPDSTRLVYDVETKDDRGVSVVLDVATGRETVLGGEKHDAYSPTWSPEGDQIAFLSIDHSASSRQHVVSQLWVMDAGGANARRLAEGEFYDAGTWGRAVESTAEAADEIPPRAPETTPPGVREEKPATKKADPPAVPKERAIASKSTPATHKGMIAVRGSNAIYLVDPDSAAAQKVPDTADMIAPAWSPDGGLLAVERVEKAGSSSIYTIRPDGSHPQLVLKNASSPSWALDGDRIFAVRSECVTPCEPEDDEANVLVGVRPDGTDARRIDFEEIAVYGDRDLASAIEGSTLAFFNEEHESIPGTFDSSAMAWSPDGARLAFVGVLSPVDDEGADGAGPGGLWVVYPDGGTPELLLKGASGRPSWSATR